MTFGTSTLCGAVAICGVAGLILAGNAVDTGAALFGSSLALFAVVFDVWLLNRQFNASTNSPR